MAIAQIITAFPAAPNAATDTPEQFSDKADAFVAHQSDNYVLEVNTWKDEANVLATDVNTDATNAELDAWEAEARQMTADSYATEAEDVFVNIWTSDGDGTFTATPTTEYSSLHWAAKAATFNPALYALLTGATFTGNVQSPKIKTDIIENVSGDKSVAVAGLSKIEDTGKNICTACMKFNGAVTPPISSGAYNIQEPTRTATGLFDIVFDSPMDNSDYAVAMGGGGNLSTQLTFYTVYAQTALGFSISVANSNGDAFSRDNIQFSIFGGKA